MALTGGRRMREIKLVFPCPNCNTVLFFNQYIPKEFTCLGCNSAYTSADAFLAVEKEKERQNNS